MAQKKRKNRIGYEELLELAYEYADECIYSTKETATAGRIVAIKSVKAPSIEFFLEIWIPKVKQMDTIHRGTFYKWWRDLEDKDKSDTITRIQSLFNAVLIEKTMNDPNAATMFVAKNKLGWVDKTEVKNTHHVEQPLFPDEDESV